MPTKRVPTHAIPIATSVTIGILGLLCAVGGCLLWADYDHMVHITRQGTNGPMGAMMVLFFASALLGLFGAPWIGFNAGARGSAAGGRIVGALLGLGLALAIIAAVGLIVGWSVPWLRADWYSGPPPAVGAIFVGVPALPTVAIGFGLRLLTDRPRPRPQR